MTTETVEATEALIDIIQARARTLYEAFEWDEIKASQARRNPAEAATIWDSSLKPGSPEWMHSAIRGCSAESGSSCDFWRVSFVREAAEAISVGDTPGRYSQEHRKSAMVSSDWGRDLCMWLGSDASRYELVNMLAEYRSEIPEGGVGEMIASGFFLEKAEVFVQLYKELALQIGESILPQKALGEFIDLVVDEMNHDHPDAPLAINRAIQDAVEIFA